MKPKNTGHLQAFLDQKIKEPQYSTEAESPIPTHETQSLHPITNSIKPSVVRKPKTSMFKQVETKEVKSKNEDLGEAAEWAELGTKNIDVDFNDQEVDVTPAVISMVDAPVFDTDAIKNRMNQKAQKLALGGFRAASSTNATRLLEKAKGIRSQNQRLSPRKQQQPSSNTPFQPPKTLPPQQPKPQITHLLPQPDSEQQDSKWNNINQQTIVTIETKANLRKLIYTGEEVKNYYVSLNLREQKRMMNIEDLKDEVVESSTSFFSCIAKKRSINSDVKTQILALTKVHISEDIDVFLLESLWKSLTDKHFMRFGNHWQQVGFQGHDPSTDLRSTGILSLLLVYFYKQKHQKLFKQFHGFCRQEQNDFPLMITLIKIVGKYTDLVTKNLVYGKSLQQYLEWYFAITHYMMNSMREKKFTINTIGEGVTDILNRIDSKLSKIRKQYQQL